MPPLVLAATTDLFLQSRILEVAKMMGFEAKFVRDERELAEAAKAADARLVVLDLSTSEYDPFTSAETLKSILPQLRILGFFPHVRSELKARAKASGIDYVVPNSGLIKNLRSILLEQEAH